MTGGFFALLISLGFAGADARASLTEQDARRTSKSGFKAKQRSRFVLDIRRYVRDYFYRDANTREAKILGDFIREKLIVTAERKVFYFHFSLGEQIKFKNFMSSFRHDFKPSLAIACVSRALNVHCRFQGHAIWNEFTRCTFCNAWKLFALLLHLARPQPNKSFLLFAVARIVIASGNKSSAVAVHRNRSRHRSLVTSSPGDCNNILL